MDMLARHSPTKLLDSLFTVMEKLPRNIVRIGSVMTSISTNKQPQIQRRLWWIYFDYVVTNVESHWVAISVAWPARHCLRLSIHFSDFLCAFQQDLASGVTLLLGRSTHQAIPANPFMGISSASPKDGLTEVQVPQNAWPMLSSLEGSWCNCQAKTAKSPVAAGVYQAVSSSFPWTKSRKTGVRFRHTHSHKLPNACNCLGVVIHDHIHKCRCDNEGYKSHVSPNMRVRTV